MGSVIGMRLSRGGAKTALPVKDFQKGIGHEKSVAHFPGVI